MADPASRLLLVEGLPGAGKSSCAQSAADLLGWHWYYEHAASHPVYNPVWLQGLLASGDYPADLPAQLLAGWGRLADRCDGAVIEGALLQNGVAPLLLAGLDESPVTDFFRAAVERIAPLAPQLIVLGDADPGEALRRVILSRAPWFEPLLIDRIGRSPWARQRRLRGLPAVEAFFSDYNEITRRLLPLWPGRILQLEGRGGWQRIEREISDWLAVAGPEPAALPDQALRRFAGRYGDNTVHPLIELLFDQGQLWLRGEGGDEGVVVLNDHHLRVRGIDLELLFAAERGGRWQRLRAVGDLDGLPASWVRCCEGDASRSRV